MYTLYEIAELRQKCYELELENCHILDKYTDFELQNICNGIGSELFPDEVRKLVSAMHPTLQPVAFIHDVEWYESDADHFTFSESNARFKTNGYICAKAKYPWYHPLRYIVMAQAYRLGNTCQLAGWFAYAKCFYDRKEKNDG